MTCSEPTCNNPIHPQSEGEMCALHEKEWWLKDASLPYEGQDVNDFWDQNEFLGKIVEVARWSDRAKGLQ